MEDLEAKPINLDSLRKKNKLVSKESLRAEYKESIEQNNQLIWKIVRNIMRRRSIPPTIEDVDLYSWGVEGLIKAKKRYDESKNASFSSYAYIRIKGEILDQLRKEWKQRSVGGYKEHKERVEKKIQEMVEATLSNGSEKLSVDSLLDMTSMVYLLSLDQAGDGTMGDNIEDKRTTFEYELESAEEKDVLDQMIGNLSDDEQTVIQLIYKQNQSQKDVAEYLKVSRSKMCRMHNQILDKLKRSMDRGYG